MWFRFGFSNVDVSGEYGFLGTVRDALQALRDAQQTRLSKNEYPNSGAADFLWRYASDMEDYGTNWVPHRVARWNQHSVLVEARPTLPDSRSQSPASRRVRTYWLDRQDLEQIGVARVRTRDVAFFLSPHAGERAIATVKAIMRLGLWFPFTEQELRQAYLGRALWLHPDVGGSEAEFVQLQLDRELAATAAGTSWTAATRNPSIGRT
jgi:hypothetical protein